VAQSALRLFDGARIKEFLMFTNYVYPVLGAKEEKHAPETRKQQPEQRIVPANYPKSEPNLQSAYVFPRGGNGEEKDNKKPE
jgi:hypothetical protein